MKSCLYRGTVKHRRRHPVEHDFEVPLFMMYLDLDELPALFDPYWLWSARRAAPAWFRRADYLGDPRVDLAESVRHEAERLTGRRPEGAIRMLTHLRTFGYVQNPVTFYYCFRSRSDELEAILAEITNTPWGERHTYALGWPEGGLRLDHAHRLEKRFHVSPFMPMDQQYEWRFSEPGPELRVHMTNRSAGDRVFDATLTLEREEIGSRSLAAALVRYPWMTARVAVGIYWQAFRLWMKRAPFHEHPEGRTA